MCRGGEGCRGGKNKEGGGVKLFQLQLVRGGDRRKKRRDRNKNIPSLRPADKNLG